MTRKSLLESQLGMEELPFRLILSLAIAIAALGIFLGIQSQFQIITQLEFESKLIQLGHSLEHLAKAGVPRDLADPWANPGSQLEFELEIPAMVSYVGLGVDPDPDNDGILGNTPPQLISDQEQNAIIYNFGGDKRRLVFEFRFREGIKRDRSWEFWDQGLVLIPGKYRLVFELVRDPESGQIMVISQLTDPWDCWIRAPQME